MNDFTIVQEAVSEARRKRSYGRGGPYPLHFRREVARLVQEGQTDAEKISNVLGVKTRTVRRWVWAESRGKVITERSGAAP